MQKAQEEAEELKKSISTKGFFAKYGLKLQNI